MALVLHNAGFAAMASAGVREEADVTALVASYSGLLYRVALSVVRSPAEAEDIVQETFLRAFEQRRKLAEVEEPKAWLVRVAWNLAMDRKRRVTPDQMEETAAAIVRSAELPADRVLAASVELGRVLTAVDKLPKDERSVLLLNAVEELSMAEIAAVMGRSESAVRALLFRARTHLQERMRAGEWSTRTRGRRAR